jgi:hypothetical protein
MKTALAIRLAECHLEIHPEKTKIVHCKDGNRKGKYLNTKFNFLGYCFTPRAAMNRKHQVFTGFGPQVSALSLKAMRQKIRELHLRRRTHVRLADIPREIAPILQGWLNSYGLPTGNAFGVEVRKCYTDAWVHTPCAPGSQCSKIPPSTRQSLAGSSVLAQQHDLYSLAHGWIFLAAQYFLQAFYLIAAALTIRLPPNQLRIRWFQRITIRFGYHPRGLRP